MSKGDKHRTTIELRREQARAQFRRTGEAVGEWEGLRPQKRETLSKMLFNLIEAEVAGYVDKHRPPEASFKIRRYIGSALQKRVENAMHRSRSPTAPPWFS